MVTTRSKAKQGTDFQHEVSAHKLGSWDQFEANKDLVEGVSTFEESLYTTPLPPDPSSELLERADKIACDIKNSTEGETPDTGHQNATTEEELFSSVRPTESLEFQFEGANSSSLSQLKSSSKAVKEKYERHNRRVGCAEYDYADNRLVFPDLTPPDLRFSVKGSSKGRKKKKRPKGINLSQLDAVSGADSEERDNIESSANSPGPRTHATGVMDSPSIKLSQKEQNTNTPTGKRKRHVQVSKPGPRDSSDTERLNQPPNTTPEKPPTVNGNTRKCPSQGCAWQTVPHGGQWQSFYNHASHRHGDEVPDTWWNEEGRFRCRDCNRHYNLSKQVTHAENCAFRCSSPPPISEPTQTGGDPRDNPAFFAAQAVAEPLPSLASICSTPLNTCKDIPNSCRQGWAKVFCECLSSAVRDNTVEAWTLLAMLPKCVLPAPHRGGEQGKTIVRLARSEVSRPVVTERISPPLERNNCEPTTQKTRRTSTESGGRDNQICYAS